MDEGKVLSWVVEDGESSGFKTQVNQKTDSLSTKLKKYKSLSTRFDVNDGVKCAIWKSERRRKRSQQMYIYVNVGMWWMRHWDKSFTRSWLTFLESSELQIVIDSDLGGNCFSPILGIGATQYGLIFNNEAQYQIKPF